MGRRLERGSRTLWLEFVNTPLLMHVIWESHGLNASMLVTYPDSEDILEWG